MDDTLVAAARDLLDEVDSHLDYAEDAEMQAAADAARDALDAGDDAEEALGFLMVEVDALLDYKDDADMQAAADALRDLLPARAPAP